MGIVFFGTRLCWLFLIVRMNPVATILSVSINALVLRGLDGSCSGDRFMGLCRCSPYSSLC